MVQTVGPLKIEGDLKQAVNTLLRETPVGAKDLFVIVYADGLSDIEGATIKGLPVMFDQGFGGEEFKDAVVIGYYVGVPEVQNG